MSEDGSPDKDPPIQPKPGHARRKVSSGYVEVDIPDALAEIKFFIDNELVEEARAGLDELAAMHGDAVTQLSTYHRLLYDLEQLESQQDDEDEDEDDSPPDVPTAAKAKADDGDAPPDVPAAAKAKADDGDAPPDVPAAKAKPAVSSPSKPSGPVKKLIAPPAPEWKTDPKSPLAQRMASLKSTAKGKADKAKPRPGRLPPAAPAPVPKAAPAPVPSTTPRPLSKVTPGPVQQDDFSEEDSFRAVFPDLYPDKTAAGSKPGGETQGAAAKAGDDSELDFHIDIDDDAPAALAPVPSGDAPSLKPEDDPLAGLMDSLPDPPPPLPEKAIDAVEPPADEPSPEPGRDAPLPFASLDGATPIEPTSTSDLIAGAYAQTRTEPPASKRWWYVGAGGGALVVLIVILAVSLGGSPKKGSAGDSKDPPTEKKRPPPEDPGMERRPPPAMEEPPRPMDLPAMARPALPETVQIKLRFTPKKARPVVTFREKRYHVGDSLNLALPRATEPVWLKIKAPGFKTHSLQVVPDKDRTYRVKLKPRHTGATAPPDRPRRPPMRPKRPMSMLIGL